MQYFSLEHGASYRTRHLLLKLCNQGVVGSNPIRSISAVIAINPFLGSIFCVDS